MYVVLGRDPSGKLTGVGTVEFCSYNGMFYALLEKRTLDANGWLTIQYRLCQSKDDNYLGVPVALSTVPYFAHLPSSYTYPKPMDSVGLIQMRMPMVNCVDGSSDAVSVYAPAVTLIHNINRNERQLDSEFENSQNRIVASRDLIKYDAFGGASIPANLFIGLDDDPGKVGLKVFNPTMRDESYERRRQGYFRSTETVIGFKRGIISEVEAVERSATEITSSAGDYNLSIIDFQNVWYDTTQETLRVCDALGQMYSLTDNTSLWNRDQLAMGWGNGILYDSKSEWEENKEMVAARLLKAEIAVAWKYNLPWETPEDLQRVREKYMPDVEELTRGLY
jgi:hypothetical protein